MGHRHEVRASHPRYAHLRRQRVGFDDAMRLPTLYDRLFAELLQFGFSSSTRYLLAMLGIPCITQDIGSSFDHE